MAMDLCPHNSYSPGQMINRYNSVLLCLLGLISLAFGASQDSMSLAERPGHTVLFPLILPSPVINEKTFQDRFIRIEFVIFTRLAFRLENRSADNIEIDWNHSSYVYPSGGAHRVFHKRRSFLIPLLMRNLCSNSQYGRKS
jgi:hypothetical protein